VPGLVATVGKVVTQPGASNVIPGRVDLSLDIRHQKDELLEEVCQSVHKQLQEICAARDIELDWGVVQKNSTIQCSPRLQHLLAYAVEQVGMPVHYLPSGAGHDAVSLARLTDIAMLFVRCAGGVSHHPDEAVTVGDIAVALDVLEHFLSSLT
jgi:allantoate deiminase